MKFRKKPVIIEAFQFDGDFIDSKGNWYVPEWAKEALENGVLYFDYENSPPKLFMKTLVWTMRVYVGDYIIQGVNGELDSCKPDIFEKTYEVVKE